MLDLPGCLQAHDLLVIIGDRAWANDHCWVEGDVAVTLGRLGLEDAFGAERLAAKALMKFIHACHAATQLRILNKGVLHWSTEVFKLGTQPVQLLSQQHIFICRGRNHITEAHRRGHICLSCMYTGVDRTASCSQSRVSLLNDQDHCAGPSEQRMNIQQQQHQLAPKADAHWA